MGFFKKLANALSSKSYRKNPKGTSLPKNRLEAINIGAINAEQTSAFCDTLETGSDKSDTQENLSEYYEIDDRKSALKTLDWFLNEGHRIYFENIKEIVSGSHKLDLNNDDEVNNVITGIGKNIMMKTLIDEGLSDEEITDMFQIICNNAFSYISNLLDKETTDFLIEENIIKDKSDFSKKSILAWDMGRLVLVTRCCYDVGYISEEEAWHYIEKAHSNSQKLYSNWKEFADAYVIGRATWGGYNMMLDGINSIAQDLVNDEDSPWVQYPLK